MRNLARGVASVGEGWTTADFPARLRAAGAGGRRVSIPNDHCDRRSASM
jgi:hypothetical protein